MSRLLFDHPGICRASFDEKTGITTHEWLDYNPDGPDSVVIGILDEIYDGFLKTGSAKVLVIANRTRGAFSPSVQKYIESIQFPRFASDTRLRFVAIVLPASMINAAYTTLWKAQLARNDRFIQADFMSTDEALAWLETIDEASGDSSSG